MTSLSSAQGNDNGKGEELANGKGRGRGEGKGRGQPSAQGRSLAARRTELSCYANMFAARPSSPELVQRVLEADEWIFSSFGYGRTPQAACEPVGPRPTPVAKGKGGGSSL